MIKVLGKKFENYLHRYAVAKTRQLLLTTDTQVLERAGISADLLHKGVAYWPWQEEASGEGDLSIAARGSKTVSHEVVYPGVTVDNVSDYSIDVETEKAA